MKKENLKRANEIEKTIHYLQCYKNAITKKEGKRFCYVKEIQTNGFLGWEFEDDELTEELTKFILSFCTKKIKKLQKEFNAL